MSETTNSFLGRNHPGRKANLALRTRILALRKAGYTISMTATLAGCSISHVKHVTAMNRSV
jgi:AraC-like DNA-binding protein